MKTLYLLRHAKSDWSAGLEDFARPLAPRGEKTAPLIGRYMKQHGFSPDVILCSPAERARQTCALVLAEIGDRPLRHVQALYLASPAELMRQVQRAEDAAASLMLVGHNPGLHSLALALAGDGEAKALAQLRAKLPTAALAVLRFDIARWRDVAVGAGRLDAFIRPRDLG